MIGEQKKGWGLRPDTPRAVSNLNGLAIYPSDSNKMTDIFADPTWNDGNSNASIKSSRGKPRRMRMKLRKRIRRDSGKKLWRLGEIKGLLKSTKIHMCAVRVAAATFVQISQITGFRHIFRKIRKKSLTVRKSDCNKASGPFLMIEGI